MAVLKWKKDATTWIGFYLDALRNRLRRDKNLSDVLNKQAARDNLELSGVNNQTHYHDDRYLPLINKETQDRTAEDVLINSKLKALTTKVDTNDATIFNNITNLTQEVSDLKYFIGPNDPGASGSRVWFDTATRTVKVCNGGGWIPFGAVFL